MRNFLILIIAFVVVTVSLSTNEPPIQKEAKAAAASKATHVAIKAETVSKPVAVEKPATPVAPPAPVAAVPLTKLVTPGGLTDWMKAAGIPASDWVYVNYITGNESGSCPTKWQGTHDCPDHYTQLYDPSTPGIGYGLCQSTPAIKMQNAGSDWTENAVTQLKWCDAYAKSRYGSWAAAYLHWTVNHNW